MPNCAIKVRFVFPFVSVSPGCPVARKKEFLQSLLRALQQEAEHAGKLTPPKFVTLSINQVGHRTEMPKLTICNHPVENHYNSGSHNYRPFGLPFYPKVQYWYSILQDT